MTTNTDTLALLRDARARLPTGFGADLLAGIDAALAALEAAPAHAAAEVTDAEKLLPCPFCSSEAQRSATNIHGEDPENEAVNVAEFIAYLQKQPQDLPVAHGMYSEYCLLDVEKIQIQELCEARPDGWIQRGRSDKPKQRYLVLPGN